MRDVDVATGKLHGTEMVVTKVVINIGNPVKLTVLTPSWMSNTTMGLLKICTTN